MIILSSSQDVAQRQLRALQTMLEAVARAQANHLGPVRHGFAGAEARALSLLHERDRYLLTVDLNSARRQRQPHPVSWVLARLNDLASSPAEVTVSTPQQVTAFLRAQGGTRPLFQTYTLGGRGYFRLPGPVTSAAVTVATVHPQTGESRTLLAIGRTLLHELTVHAWRDVTFYQRVPGSDQPPADLATGSEHQDRPHRPNSLGQHSLTDAEADLIDYYYDLALGHDIQFGEAHHPGFARIIRVLGGVMASRLPSLVAPRRAAADYASEQARFVQQARLFAQQAERMRRLETRASNSSR